ncbi:S-layer homology domain-containing protein [Geomicrobium sp. JSM 1781026]|uniref:S-layer homology domain-containing protein n=1 Tax=Geomicrobium sp. JSM 1781026 TaxID=3344580 RepID=UPI0035C1A5EB
MRSYRGIFLIIGTLLLLTACSGDSATADEIPQAAGDDWVDTELNELNDKISNTEDRAEKLAIDIQLLQEGRSFSDVRTNFYAFEEIEYLTSLSVINGYSDGTFKPNNSITRGQTATMLVRELGLTAPSDYELQAVDVSPNHANIEALRIAEYNKIMTGNNGKLTPGNPLTRSQMARVLVRAYPNKIPETDNHYTFTDIQEGDSGYTEVNRIADSRITTQVNTAYRPNESTSRAQFSIFISRTINEDFR